ncbi:WYL domain-containing protein [Micromonospora sp. M12]
MPSRLRAEMRAVHGSTETLIGPVAEIDGELLVTLARACRDAVRVRFHYPGRAGGEQERTVEPIRMVTTGRRWYLMAWDVDRDDWRTFRLDRMRAAVTTTWRFRAREHPDPVAFVQRAVTEAPYRHLARARVHARPTGCATWFRPRWGVSRTTATGGACWSSAGESGLARRPPGPSGLRGGGAGASGAARGRRPARPSPHGDGRRGVGAQPIVTQGHRAAVRRGPSRRAGADAAPPGALVEGGGRSAIRGQLQHQVGVAPVGPLPGAGQQRGAERQPRAAGVTKRRATSAVGRPGGRPPAR